MDNKTAMFDNPSHLHNKSRRYLTEFFLELIGSL